MSEAQRLIADAREHALAMCGVTSDGAPDLLNGLRIFVETLFHDIEITAHDLPEFVDLFRIELQLLSAMGRGVQESMEAQASSGPSDELEAKTRKLEQEYMKARSNVMRWAPGRLSAVQLEILNHPPFVVEFD